MRKTRRLIVFFTPPQKFISGGVLSIFSLCQVSRQFHDIHKSEVVLCVYPGHKSYGAFDLFDNDEMIYSFDDVVKMGPLDHLQLHIPEYASSEILDALTPYEQYLQTIPELGVNILNQNIKLMPSPATVAEWFSITPSVTQTTAHIKYSTQTLADEYNIPTHHLSTYLAPDQYHHRAYKDKENIIILSPDDNPERSKILARLADQLPNYELITIKDMRYEDYKDLVSRAKFAITFGEGFDGYYVEPFFTGGISFAVYNDDFFPDKTFSTFDNTYKNYQDMYQNIVSDIQRLDSDQAAFNKLVGLNYNKITKLYHFDIYKNNLKLFYLKQFTYLPNKDAPRHLFEAVLNAKMKLRREVQHIKVDQQAEIDELTALTKSQERVMEEAVNRTQNLEKVIDSITTSVSWKLTKPLRGARVVTKKAHRH